MENSLSGRLVISAKGKTKRKKTKKKKQGEKK